MELLAINFEHTGVNTVNRIIGNWQTKDMQLTNGLRKQSLLWGKLVYQRIVDINKQ